VSDFNRNAVDFLKIDADTGLTFVWIASGSADALPKKARNQANARKAYDCVLTWTRRLVLGELDRQEIGEKLAQLKTALQGLGEKFEEN
jgi:hypothetical protein